jgi:hypothetical protein
MIQPSREWLLKMAELEDKHDCISVGGLYAELGFPVNGDGVLRLRLLFGMMIADCTDSDEPEPTEVL